MFPVLSWICSWKGESLKHCMSPLLLPHLCQNTVAAAGGGRWLSCVSVTATAAAYLLCFPLGSSLLLCSSAGFPTFSALNSATSPCHLLTIKTRPSRTCSSPPFPVPPFHSVCHVFMSSDHAFLLPSPVEKVDEPNRCGFFSCHHSIW